jgi:hypothetical protein
MIARATIVGERYLRAGDDAFEAHHAHALTAFARRGLKHDTELARRNAGQFISMLGLCRGAVKGSLAGLPLEHLADNRMPWLRVFLFGASDSSSLMGSARCLIRPHERSRNARCPGPRRGGARRPRAPRHIQPFWHLAALLSLSFRERPYSQFRLTSLSRLAVIAVGLKCWRSSSSAFRFVRFCLKRNWTGSRWPAARANLICQVDGLEIEPHA